MEKLISRTPPILFPVVIVIGLMYIVAMIIVSLLGFWKCDKCNKWFHCFKEEKYLFATHFLDYNCDVYCSRCAKLERR